MILNDSIVEQVAQPQDPQIAQVFERLLPLATVENVPSGILHWSLFRPGKLAAFDGEAAAEPIDQETWEQMIHEIREGSLGPDKIPTVAELKEKASAGNEESNGTVRIALANVRYHSLRKIWMGRILSAMKGRSVFDLPANRDEAIAEHRAFLVSALLPTNYEWIDPQPHVYHGLKVRFLLDPQLMIGNTGETIEKVEIDYDDGHGFRPVKAGTPEEVSYGDEGFKTIRLNCVAGGRARRAAFRFQITALAAPKPDETWDFRGRHGGEEIRGVAWVFYGKGHKSLVSPLIMADGFPGGHTLDYLWGRLQQQNFAQTMLNREFDLIILTYERARAGATYLQTLANIAVQCIQRANERRVGRNKLVVGGVSMGGLVTRYALCSMLKQGLDPQTRLFLTFDSPHDGASIPLGIQSFVSFFRSQSATVEAQAQLLSSISAQQMLYQWIPDYKYSGPVGNNAYKIAFRNELMSLGWFPAIRRIALANGMGKGEHNGIKAGERAVRWHGNICVWSDVYTTPVGERKINWQGYCAKVDFWNNYSTYLSNSPELDGAPGGLRDTYGAVADGARESGYGWVDNPIRNHCFVPSVSALSITCSSNLYHNIAANPCSNFNSIKWSQGLMFHTDLSPDLATWLIGEIGFPSATEEVPELPVATVV
jgi:hypothetical protein